MTTRPEAESVSVTGTEHRVSFESSSKKRVWQTPVVLVASVEETETLALGIDADIIFS